MRFFIISLLALVLVTSCREEIPEALISIHLTDTSAPYEQVNIDLEGIHVRMASDPNTAIALDTRTGIYDLLAVDNGVTLLLAEDMVPEGTIAEVRFMLGLDNTVVVDGTEHTLLIPAGHDSGYPVTLNLRVEAGKPEMLTLEFDAAASVSENPSGGYFFHPIIKMVE